MNPIDPRSQNLADFHPGHATDPLRAPEDFVAWVDVTKREQSLFQRSLAGRAGPRTRVLTDRGAREVLNLASLDYLGLNAHPAVAAAVRGALEEWGVGACGVPLLTGTTVAHRALEHDVAALLHREASMLFSSGFSGGIGLAAALLRRGDVAIADEKAHICWMDGVRTAGAKLVTFPHGDAKGLDAALSRHTDARRVVIVDGLYSMDGDTADLPALLDVTEAHGVGLIVDEAHSAFALGASGGGVTEQRGVEARVRLFFGTFSKALAMVGGFASGGHDLIEYARLYAHPFGFSAALPPAYVVGMREAVRVARGAEGAALRRKLADNADHFRRGVRAMGLSTGESSTHVVPILLGSDRRLLYEAGQAMLDRGLYIVPIDFPAVPEDALRFRASISAAHDRVDLDAALSILEDAVARPLRRAAGVRPVT